MNVSSGPCSCVVTEKLMMVGKQLGIRTITQMHSQELAFLEQSDSRENAHQKSVECLREK